MIRKSTDRSFNNSKNSLKSLFQPAIFLRAKTLAYSETLLARQR